MHRANTLDIEPHIAEPVWSIDALSRRFVRQQQAQLDQLFREGDIDDAIRTLIAEIEGDGSAGRLSNRYCRRAA